MKITEHTQKWLDALRGGDYQQCRYILQHDNGYCCLGVAAKIANIQIPFDQGTGIYAEISEAVGLEKGEMGCLMELNDTAKKTFTEIADEIEKMLDAS